MSLTINLTPAEEERLKAAALDRGISTHEMAEKLLSKHLPVGRIGAPDQVEEMNRRIAEWQRMDNTPRPQTVASRHPELSPTAALFARWAQEDENLTAEEIAADDKLWDEFRSGIDEARSAAGMRTVF